MAVWRETAVPGKKAISIGNILFMSVCAVIWAFLLLAIYDWFYPTYDYSIEAKNTGPEFELRLTPEKMHHNHRNYPLTELEGQYSTISISDTLPVEEACLSTLRFARKDGILHYGYLSKIAMEKMGRKNVEECIINITKYLDRRYIPADINNQSFNID